MSGVLYRLATQRPWVSTLALGLLAAWLSIRGKDASSTTASTDKSKPFASTNPWRPLPTDPGVDKQLRELSFITETLGDFWTVPLPEDDFSLYDRCLRSLETRKDILWVSYHALDLGGAVSRMGEVDSSVLPHDAAVQLSARAKALSQFWHELELSPEGLDVWLEACDTKVLPPFLAGGGAEPLTGLAALGATEAQIATSNAVYDSWRERREHKVSYLKDNPPRPMGFAPKTRDQVGLQEAWDSLVGVEALGGRPVDEALLDGNTRWKPIYSTLLVTARVPFTWQDPSRGEPTDEDLRRTEQREEVVRVHNSRRLERQRAQKDYLRQRKEAQAAAL